MYNCLKGVWWLLLGCWLALPMANAQDAVENGAQHIKSFVGQNIVIPIENPDTVQIDRRDIIDYAKDLPEDEKRPILYSKRYGEANVKVSKEGKDQYFHVQVSDPNQNDQSMVIQQLVGDPNLHVRFAGQSIILEGEVRDDIVAQKALKVAAAFSANVINFLTIADPLQINVKVQVLTVDLNKLSNIGVQYRANHLDLDGNPMNGFGVGLSVSDFAKGSLPFFNITRLYDPAGGVGDFSAMINAELNQQVSKLLQAPTLTTINGQPAYFLVGQDVPLLQTTTAANAGTTSTSATYRSIGISLLITPIVDDYGGMNPSIYKDSNSYGGGSSTPTADNTYTLQRAPGVPTTVANTIDENGLIRLLVKPEVTSVAPKISNSTVNQTYPTFNRKYMETRVALRHMESLVIGGLIDDESMKNFEAIPFISQIPILGELFKNRGTNNTRQELIFVLTPQILGRNYSRAGAPYRPKSSEMRELMQKGGVPYYGAKPTRISASEITPRAMDEGPDVAENTPAQTIQALRQLKTGDNLDQKSARSTPPVQTDDDDTYIPIAPPVSTTTAITDQHSTPVALPTLDTVTDTTTTTAANMLAKKPDEPKIQ